MCKIPPLANASGILHIGGGLHPQMRRHPTFVGLRHIYRFAKLLHLQTSFAFRNFANPPPLSVSVKRQPTHKWHIWFLPTHEPTQKTKRAIFCQRTDKTVENFLITFYLRK
jgi:hypothetical protein